MADIQNRFGKDMLVLTSPISSELTRLGIDAEKDGPYTLLLEPEVVEDAYKLESISGAQCIVADTGFIVASKLAHSKMVHAAQTLANNALEIANNLRPQHVLVEIDPCGLPLDSASKASLIENRDQYMRAAMLYADTEFDAFFLNSFTRCADLKCALMGIRMVSDKPIFASVVVDLDGNLCFAGSEQIEEAIDVMCEYGADVVGFQSACGLSWTKEMVNRVKSVCTRPILVQLCVSRRDPEQVVATEENPYFEPDTMIDAADDLRAAGVQFLRAVGDATPAYTGALVAATDRLDVVADDSDSASFSFEDEDIDSVAERLRAKVSAALSRDADDV